MERLIETTPGWDKRDPDPTKNYGIHCDERRMVLKGELGAVQYLTFLGTYPPELGIPDNKPTPADLGYHSPVPMYEGQEAVGSSKAVYETVIPEPDAEEHHGMVQVGDDLGFRREDGTVQVMKRVPTGSFDPCPYLDGRPCYYDGSGLNAQRVYDVELQEGLEGVWSYLEDYYISTFGELR